MAQRITARLWPDAAAGPWRLAFAWVEIDGQYECVGLEITSETRISDQGRSPAPGPARPITTSEVFRRLPLAQLVAEERRREAFLARWRYEHPSEMDVPDAYFYSDEGVTEGLRAVKAGAEVDHPRWAGTSRPSARDRWQKAADVYIKAGQEGEDPTVAVSKAFTISRSAAGKLVARARAAGFLPPTTRGRANTSTPVQRRKR